VRNPFFLKFPNFKQNILNNPNYFFWIKTDTSFVLENFLLLYFLFLPHDLKDTLKTKKSKRKEAKKEKRVVYLSPFLSLFKV